MLKPCVGAPTQDSLIEPLILEEVQSAECDCDEGKGEKRRVHVKEPKNGDASLYKCHDEKPQKESFEPL